MMQSGAAERASDQLLRWVDRTRWWWLAGVALLYGLGFNGQWRIGSDSALYLELARNVHAELGYTYHGEAQTMVGPALPHVIAGLWKVTVPGDMVIVNAAMCVAILLGLALVYRLMRLHTDRATAVLVVVLTGLAETVFRYAFQVLTEPLFFLGVMAVLAGYEGLVQARRGRGAMVADGVLLMLGVTLAHLTRPVSWVLIGALGAAIGWSLVRRRQWGVHLLMAGSIVIAIAAATTLHPRKPGGEPGRTYESGVSEILMGSGHLRRVMVEFVPHYFEGEAAKGMVGTELAPGVNTLIGLVVLAGSVVLLRRRMLWGAWTGLTIAMMFAITPNQRYFLPILPLLIFAIWEMLRWMNHRLREPWAGWCFAASLLVLVAPNLFGSIDYMINQRRTPFLAHYKHGRYVGMEAAVEDLAARHMDKADTLLIAEAGRLLSYWSGKRVVAASRFRHAQFEPPTIEAAHVLLLKPVREGTLAALAEQGWRVGPSVWEWEDADGETWTLHWLDRATDVEVSR